MTTRQQILDFYSRPAEMTSADKYARLFDELPAGVARLAHIVQGLGVYDVVAQDFYGFDIPNERRNEIHLRPLEDILDRIFALDDQPLTVTRPVEKRLVSRCRTFLLLHLAMLRAKGIPARARCGFGAYFNPGTFEDHWVCEYWRAADARWVLVDSQFDDVWQRQLKINHDVMDVPRDRFLVAGDAWARCRAGKADPDKFGISFDNLYGLWYVAGNLVRDIAALNKMEMLPWDVWGGQPKPDAQFDDAQLTFFDQLAALARDPDGSFDELRKIYQEDDRLRVPATVFNALLNRSESL